MASGNNYMKQISLTEVKRVIDSLEVIAENTLYTYSLALVISKSGEATFTSSCWKLLNEVEPSSPLDKLICKAAINYTSFCGDDCKFFLFILKEVFGVIYKKLTMENESCMRLEIINELFSFKQILSSTYESIREMSDSYRTNINSIPFSQSLRSMVSTFMSARFSVSVCNVLSPLICDFVQNICEEKSMKIVLDYVISHFDIFCCKILSSLSESRVLKGLLLYTKHIPSALNLENINFIIIWDLKMKVETLDVTWKIKDESFIAQLNPLHVYKKIFDYFKSRGIMLILTPSYCDNKLKSFCKNNDISIVDHLDVQEVEHVLYCFQLSPLADLNESLELKHIGMLNCAKSLFLNESHFLHLKCVNTVRTLNAHHILLSAPSNAMWKEYYSECLNCLKMILVWLSSGTELCFQESFRNKVPEEDKIKVLQLSECFRDSSLKHRFENETEYITNLNVMKSNLNKGILLPPCSWELMFKAALEKVMRDSVPPCSIIVQAFHLAISKSICKKVNVPFTVVNNIESVCSSFMKKCNLGEVKFLEPLICKEVMINNILDLILQLLKVDSIVFAK